MQLSLKTVLPVGGSGITLRGFAMVLIAPLYHLDDKLDTLLSLHIHDLHEDLHVSVSQMVVNPVQNFLTNLIKVHINSSPLGPLLLKI